MQRRSRESTIRLSSLESRETRFMRSGQETTTARNSHSTRAAELSDLLQWLRSLSAKLPGKRIPRPLEVIEHHGDSPAVTVCQEILALTKLNWNSCAFGAAFPSRSVSRVTLENPDRASKGRSAWDEIQVLHVASTPVVTGATSSSDRDELLAISSSPPLAGLFPIVTTRAVLRIPVDSLSWVTQPHLFHLAGGSNCGGATAARSPLTHNGPHPTQTASSVSSGASPTTCSRDVYVRGKYRDVILPMTVIRRLDALLEPTKEAVLKMKAQLDKAKIANRSRPSQGFQTLILQHVAIHASPPAGQPKQLRANFTDYLDGFRPTSARSSRNSISQSAQKLDESDVLGHLITKFP